MFSKSLNKVIYFICIMFFLGTIPIINSQANNYIPNVQLTSDSSGNLNINNTNNKDTLEDKDKKEKIYNSVLGEYRGIVVFLLGIGLLSMILFFILNFIALGNSKGNPQERQKAIHGLITTGIATAGLGSATLIATLFYNMIKDKSV